MPRGEADTKAARLLRLIALFANQPRRGYTAIELADELGCGRRTVVRYIAELDGNRRLPLYMDEQNRYRLVEDGRVTLGDLKLDLREGTALYLAARLLAQQTDEYNLHVMNALDRLVRAMPEQIAAGLRGLAAAAAVTRSRGRDVSEIFSALVLGWAHRRVVTVRYRPARFPAAYTCRLHPYLFEPSGIGRTIYVIGHATPPGDLRTLKLERIEHAVLTGDEFTVPNAFDGAALLGRAWGVMYGDDEPVPVRLRFSRFVAERVKETVWHRTQTITDQSDGGCLWEATIGDTIEIGPWVRGWGSDCEVLEPTALRDDVIGHVRRMVRCYGLAEAPSPSDERGALDDIFG